MADLRPKPPPLPSPKVPHARVLTTLEREARFGKPDWEWDPAPGNPERIRIAAKWQLDHLRLTQLEHPTLGIIRVTLHRGVALRFSALWEAWRAEGLLPLVLAAQTFSPRFRRTLGSEADRLARCRKQYDDESSRDDHLSCHTWGIAMDLNPAQNPQGKSPAPMGAHGCVLPLIDVAEQLGFVSGGRFRVQDFMHIEIGA